MSLEIQSEQVFPWWFFRVDEDVCGKGKKKRKKRKSQKMPKLLDVDVEDSGSVFEGCASKTERREAGYLVIHKSLQLGCNKTYGAARRKLAKWCELHSISEADSSELVQYLNELFLAGYSYSGIVHQNFIDIPDHVELQTSPSHTKLKSYVDDVVEEGCIRYPEKGTKALVEFRNDPETLSKYKGLRFMDYVRLPCGVSGGRIVGERHGLLWWHRDGDDGATVIAQSPEATFAMLMHPIINTDDTASNLSSVKSGFVDHDPNQIIFPDDAEHTNLILFDGNNISLKKFGVRHGDVLETKNNETGIIIGGKLGELYWCKEGTRHAVPISVEEVKTSRVIPAKRQEGSLWSGARYSRFPLDLTLDDPVIVKRKGGVLDKGVVKYIGFPKLSSESYSNFDGCWVGVALEEPNGNHNGTFNGERFFTCESNHGIFTRADNLELGESRISGSYFLYPHHHSQRFLRFDIRREVLKRYNVMHGDLIQSKQGSATVVGIRNNLLYVHHDKESSVGAVPLRPTVNDCIRVLKRYRLVGNVRLRNFVNDMLAAPSPELARGARHIPNEVCCFFFFLNQPFSFFKDK